MWKMGKATKTEIFLLTVTALFLAALLWMSYGSQPPQPDSFTVAPQRQAQQTEERTRLNLNTATAEELEALEGIGPVLAQRILDYRRAQGGFTSVEELMEVKGIGESKLDALRSVVTVENTTEEAP